MSDDHQADALLDRAAKAESAGQKQHAMGKMINCPTAPLPEVQTLLIASVRQNESTQHRIAPDPSIITEYAELMQAGVIFPPITVWWDGESYWLSDGFRRIAAAECANLRELPAEIHLGTLTDAQWASYAANATHGLRRSRAETEAVIQRALQHPAAASLSNVCISKHLQVPEATVRYWRNKLSSQSCEDDFRIVTRGSTTYRLTTRNLGKNAGERRAKPRRDFRAELAEMKEKGSPPARRVLNIVGHWVLGDATPLECLDALERFVQYFDPHSATAGAQRQDRDFSADLNDSGPANGMCRGGSIGGEPVT